MTSRQTEFDFHDNEKARDHGDGRFLDLPDRVPAIPPAWKIPVVASQTLRCVSRASG